VGHPGLAELEHATCRVEQCMSIVNIFISQLHAQTHTTLSSTWPGHIHMWHAHET